MLRAVQQRRSEACYFAMENTVTIQSRRSTASVKAVPSVDLLLQGGHQQVGVVSPDFSMQERGIFDEDCRLPSRPTDNQIRVLPEVCGS